MVGADGWLLAGRYRFVEPIGHGGMGVVWRAFDTGLDREVAVKELRLPEWVGEEERHRWYARMEREARAAARLKHPGIVTVYDRVVEDGRPWIVMELIHGGSLADELKRHDRLPVRRVAAIGLRMLEAVSVAHAQGVIHRDIKPANVLLEGDRVVLTDFGIAALEGDVTLTRTGAILGTPVYMSPEQVAGSPGPESDLWSLGATLYAAVEGHPPFTGPTDGAVFAAIATQDPTPPAHAGALAPVLNGLLRKTPSERLTTKETGGLLTSLTSVPSPERDESEDRGSSDDTITDRNKISGPDSPEKLTFHVRPPAHMVIANILVAFVVVTAGVAYCAFGRPESALVVCWAVFLLLPVTIGVLVTPFGGKLIISREGIEFPHWGFSDVEYFFGGHDFRVKWSNVIDVVVASESKSDSPASVLTITSKPAAHIHKKLGREAVVRRIDVNLEMLREAFREFAPGKTRIR
ncbi:hypothetical protein GCM10023195_22660 [Actinoallomurus liliacearum]|uniref:non-specific serine/threonine protein kinase n=1 Tax=Actinoallomurus liliacearum TaxID=1080073 RepID=A0ABP8TES3_9ACTN